jgi:D-proline reductase (dithiol) PrdB
MTKAVDSYRFLSGATRLMVKQWIARADEQPIPWSPASSLGGSTVALLSSGGIALCSDEPFDQETERRNPWWGDPSYRILPGSTTTPDIRVWHLHVNPANAEHDINCLFPIERLNALERIGFIGAAAPRHYSVMGYILDPADLLAKSVPSIIAHMQEDGVDLAALVPS